MRFLFLFLCFLSVLTPSFAEMPVKDFSKLPVLHEGRVKPLSTYAKVTYQALSGHAKGDESIRWLVAIIFDPRKGLQQPVLLISNPEVRDVLELKDNAQHLFSPVEILEAFQPHKNLMQELFTKSKDELTLAQSQLVNLHFKTMWILDMSRSLSLLRPLFYVNEPDNVTLLRMEKGQRYTYLDMFSRYKLLTDAIDIADHKYKNIEQLPAAELELFKIGQLMRIVGQDAGSSVLAIVPPQWNQNDKEVGLWRSPWAVVSDGQGSPVSAEYLDIWQKMNMAWLAEKHDDFAVLSNQAITFVNNHDFISKPWLLSLEVSYNKLQFFYVSMWLYLLAVFLMIGYLGFGKKILYKAGIIIGGGTLAYHIAGVLSRILILQRPPVGTLYESILFVAAVAVCLGFLLEWRKKDGLGLFAGMLSGFALLVTAQLFAAEGDSMGMLMAVLNTNFWLTTHVLIITSGYAFCVIAAVMAHVYLIQTYRNKSTLYLNSLYKNTMGILLVALLATALGTLLGGIWADQSWGRFWGWDPKENGALLIVLWIVWLLHGRLAKILNNVTFMAGIALLTIVVGVAWFGVNLLSVGLHSYGFSDQTFYGLIGFCFAQLSLVLGLVFFILKKGPLRAS